MQHLIEGFGAIFPQLASLPHWEINPHLCIILQQHLQLLGPEYLVQGDIAIHRTATIEEGVVLKGPVIIAENCFVGAHAYLRGGVYLGAASSIGPGCEVKTSILFTSSALAHFNFIGDSILGSHVNMEAGAICANHFNERQNKRIQVLYEGQVLETGIEKLGALIGDYTTIGANAVLSPGTVLLPHSRVKRLELIEQIKETPHDD